jgi:hypothetical protein
MESVSRDSMEAIVFAVTPSLLFFSVSIDMVCKKSVNDIVCLIQLRIEKTGKW